MARQKGIFKIKGTVGGMTFYSSQDGDMVREKGGVSGDRIANDPSFARTRENGQEFGMAGSSGKVLRDSCRTLMMDAHDSKVVDRVTKLMMGLLKLDTTGARGSRIPARGLASPAGKALLKGFNFNLQAVLGSVLVKPWVLDKARGAVLINDLVPINDIAYPSGATHVLLRSAVANIDFVTGVSDVQVGDPVIMELNGTSNNLELRPAQLPVGTGTVMYLLKIEFTQIINGVQYHLKNGANNALEILDVD